MCEQIPDMLIMAGRNVYIEPLSVMENEAIAKVPEKAMPINTGHIRGYVAYWELIDNELYLNRLEGGYQFKSDSPVFADWISAIIYPASRTYGEHFEINVENGRVITLENSASASL